MLSTTSTTAFLNWTAPLTTTAGVPAITGYEVRLQPGNIVARVGGGLNATVSGLTPNTTYTATIAAVNSNGAGSRTEVEQYDSLSVSSFVTNAAPDALTNVSSEAYTYQDSATGKLVGCVHLADTTASTGVQGDHIGAIYYGMSNSATRVVGTTQEYCRLPLGQTVTVFVAAYNGLTPGPATSVTITVPSVVTGAPLNVTASARVTTLTDGSKNYIVDTNWSAPNAPSNPATLKSYQVTIFDNTNDVAYWRTYKVSPDQTSWSGISLRPNTQYEIQIAANYDRTVPNQAAPWVVVTTPS